MAVDILDVFAEMEAELLIVTKHLAATIDATIEEQARHPTQLGRELVEEQRIMVSEARAAPQAAAWPASVRAEFDQLLVRLNRALAAYAH